MTLRSKSKYILDIERSQLFYNIQPKYPRAHYSYTEQAHNSAAAYTLGGKLNKCLCSIDQESHPVAQMANHLKC